MNITDIIKELSLIKSVHGDIEVFVKNDEGYEESYDISVGTSEDLLDSHTSKHCGRDSIVVRLL